MKFLNRLPETVTVEFRSRWESVNTCACFQALPHATDCLRSCRRAARLGQVAEGEVTPEAQVLKVNDAVAPPD